MRVRLSGNLLRYTDLQNQVDVEGVTIGAVLANLTQRYPELTSVLFDSEGRVRRVHRLALNSEVLTRVDSEHPVCQTDELSVLTAIAGG